MNKTILKINILVLILALMIGMTSTKVFAQTTTQLDFTNANFTETSGEGWNWNKAQKTLTLDGANISTETSKTILLPDAATIIVNSDSSINTMQNDAIYSEGSLTIKGKGTLTANSTKGQIITAKGNLNIENAKIKGTTGGIFSYKNITVTNSNIDILSDRNGINTNSANADIKFVNSTLKLISSKYESNPNTQYYGISTGGGDSTTNGNISFINTTATIKYYFGISARSSNAQNGGSAVLIDGGKLDITGGGPSANYADVIITNGAKLDISTRNQNWAVHSYFGNIIVDKNSNVKVSGTGNGLMINNGKNVAIKITDSIVKVLLPNSNINAISSVEDIIIKNSDVRAVSRDNSGMGTVYAGNKISIDGGTFVVKDVTGSGYDLYTPNRYATNNAKIYYSSNLTWFLNDSIMAFYKSTIDNNTGDVLDYQKLNVYGDVHISEDYTINANQQLIVSAGSKLTLDKGTKIINNGTFATAKDDNKGITSSIVNDGEIINNNTMVISAIGLAPYTTCDLINNGTIYNNKTITNKGKIVNNGKIINFNDSTIVPTGDYAKYSGNEPYTKIDHDLDFSQESVQNLYNNPEGAVYWNNNKLTIKNLILTGNIILPAGQDITINTRKNIEITGNIYVKNGNEGKVTFIGETLTLNGSINGENGSIIIDGTRVNAQNVSGTNNTSKLILKNGAYLNVTNGCYFGASGATSGEIILDGASTLESNGDYATVGSGKFTIKDLKSKIIISVLEGNTAISSGREDAYAGIQTSKGTHFGKIYSDTYTILNEKEEPANTLELSRARYNINASAGEGGTISNSGENKVEYNDNKEFTISPNEGYIIKNVIIDGKSKGILLNYKFENVNADHTIVVEFEKIKFTVTLTVGKGGTTIPENPIAVEYGEDKTITIKNLEGYTLKNVIVDGKQYDVKNNIIELKDIKQNIKIEINFATIVDDTNKGNDDKEDNKGNEDDNDKEENKGNEGNNDKEDEKGNEEENESNNDKEDEKGNEEEDNRQEEKNTLNTVKTGDNVLSICILTIIVILTLNILVIIKRKESK